MREHPIRLRTYETHVLRRDKPGSVGPIDKRRVDLASGQIHRLERRAAADRLETVIALRAAPVSRGSNRGPAILQLGD